MKHLLLGSLLGCMLVGQVNCTENAASEAFDRGKWEEGRAKMEAKFHQKSLAGALTLAPLGIATGAILTISDILPSELSPLKLSSLENFLFASGVSTLLYSGAAALCELVFDADFQKEIDHYSDFDYCPFAGGGALSSMLLLIFPTALLHVRMILENHNN